ncbi:hypothetical protein BKA66DRAFT_584969 [Pyrenochaeta sp. MPI-SDFR-AT-0127]|nr:hypothetical protein BKA66DRAFT_584969 [Pyrenochaeta sp. MPI-SDFR-AT-0127]
MLSLPLAKLSVARDADSTEQRFTWQHEIHDIFFVLDTYGTRGSSQLLKVVQGIQVQVRSLCQCLTTQIIEIERLINEGHELTRSMSQRGVEVKAEELPVSAMVRCPLLAIRWQLPNKMIRRVQLKFKTSEAFETAHTHLHQLGLHISPPREGQVQPRSQNPSSKQAPWPSAIPGLISAANSHKSTSRGLSCPPSRLAEISSRPYTAINIPTNLELQRHETAHVRPMSAHNGYNNEQCSNAVSPADPLAPPVYFARPTSATSDILRDASSTCASQFREQPISNIEGAPQGSSERPETATLYDSHLDAAESMLPPRRELPFSRSSLPRSSGSDTVRPPSRPLTSMMGPPPLPARVTSLRPSSSLGIGQDAELPPLPQPTVITKSASLVPVMQQLPRTPNQDQDASIRRSPHAETDNQRPLSSNPASSPLSFTTPSSTAFPMSRPLSMHNSTTQNVRQSTSKPALAAPPIFQATCDDSTVSRVAPELSAGGNNILAAYVAQPEEERRAALNEFVFQNLENDDFLKLVEDMETCWARVALGMQ